MPRLRLQVGVAMLTVAVLVSACSGSGETSGAGRPADGGTLTVLAPTPPISVNPAKNGKGVPLDWYNSLAYEPLVYRQPDNSLKAGLATSWKYAAHNTALTLNLRPGVRFSDGSALTAETVVEWIKYYQRAGTYSFTLADLASITATGPLQVKFTLSRPDPLYLEYLDQEGVVGLVASLPATRKPAVMDAATFGAGPYMLDEDATVPNSSYVYTRNPYFFDKSQQHFKKIVISIAASNSSVLSSLQTGQAQVALGDVTTADSAKDAGLDVTTAPAQVNGVLIIDRAGKLTPALQKLPVRQALNYAINRDGIAKAIYGNYGSPAQQYKPRGTDGYAPGLHDYYPYDPKKAKRLLAQAGYPHGFSFEMLTQPTVPGGSLLAQAMTQEWAEIGVHVKLINSTSFGDYVGKLRGVDSVATTDTYPLTTYLFESTQLFSASGTYNKEHVADPQLDSLTAQLQNEAIGSDAFDALEQRLMSVAVEHAIAVPVAFSDTIIYSTKEIAGIKFSSSFPIPNPSQWYLVKK